MEWCKGLIVGADFVRTFLFLIMLLGFVHFDTESWKWTSAAVAIYSLPFLFYCFRWKLLCAYALSLVGFVLFQALISVGYYPEIVTLQPNITIERTYNEGALPGFSGHHRIMVDLQGFRTTRSIDYLHKSLPRIFTIGGSTTEEIYLDNSLTWSATLQKIFNEYEVINTGLSGLITPYHYTTLKGILKYKPDIVVFLMGINDWNKQIRRHIDPSIGDVPTEFALRRTLLGRYVRMWLLEPDSVKGRFGWKESEVSDVKTDPLASRRGSLSKPQKISFYPEDVSNEFRSNLIKIAKKCHDAKIKCLFVTQPNAYRPGVSEEMKKSFWMTPPIPEPITLDFDSMVFIADLYNRTLIKIAEQSGISVCDIRERLNADLKDFYDDCHFTPAGSEKVGRAISDCIQSL